MAKHQLGGADYVQLYQFFQSRADDIKAALFGSVTWILGFAAAIMGFTVVTFFDLSAAPARIKFPWLGMIACFVGVLHCVYALLLLYDGANHIRGNWDRANKCADHVEDLPAFTLGSRKRRSFGKVWLHMGGVVAVLLIGFIVLTLVFAAAA